MDKTTSNEHKLQAARFTRLSLWNWVSIRWWMGLVLVTSDLLALLVSTAGALFLWSLVKEELDPGLYVSLLPVLLVFIIAYLLANLYPGVGISPVEEMRRLTLSTTAVFLLLGTLSFYIRNADMYSRASFGLAWLFALVCVPLARKVFRGWCAAHGLWGEMVAIIGYGERGYQVIKYLSQNPKLGFKPVAIIDGFASVKAPPSPIPLYRWTGRGNPLAMPGLRGVRTAFLISSEVPQEFLTEVAEGRWFPFHRLILVPDNPLLGSLWVETLDLGGMLGLQVRQNLISSAQQSLKRLIDISIVLLFSPILMPIFGLLSLYIKLDSPGSALYRQERLGRGGKLFRIWKFRTMVVDAELVMREYLANHPEDRKEWMETQKLRNDPRITRAGRLLRRLSLDELPQLINVLFGEMSLVGPRPILPDQIDRWGERFPLYTRVCPGLTGLWQVSGRNETTFEMRIRMDEYYIRNWSIWMDMYVLAQTIRAVLSGKGAY